MEDLKQKVLNHGQIKEFRNYFVGKGIYTQLKLVGGALVDILEGNIPKDYDFILWTDNDVKVFESNGFIYLHDTSTAKTYTKNDGTIVQFLKTKEENFDFTISQSSLKIINGDFELDEVSFYNKTLIPVDFKNPRNVMNSLVRIPHWRKKGFEIKDITYFSLLSRLGMSVTTTKELIES